MPQSNEISLDGVNQTHVHTNSVLQILYFLVGLLVIVGSLVIIRK